MGKRKFNTENFKIKAREVHGGKYDYSKSEYKKFDEKVCIICPIHGEFWQTPHNHLNGQNCPKCSHRSTRYSVLEFIQKAREIHGNKYDYSKVEYVDNKTKVCIICPTHGEFWIKPNNHLGGQGCAQCGLEKNKEHFKLTKEEFIEKAKEIHDDKYDYSKVKYVNNKTKVCIICPIHGEFWQIPSNHLKNHGCPKCNSSKIEAEVNSFLSEKDIAFIFQKRFDWLGLKSLDFYLPKYNVAIECQGIQHFNPSKNNKSFFNEKKVKEIKKNDLEKKELCENHGVKVFYYSNCGIEYPYKVYEDFEEMFNDIKDCDKETENNEELILCELATT